MSSQLTPSKRPHDQSGSEPNGKGKLQKPTFFTSQSTSFKITPGSVIFRVLCLANKSESVIGKGGNKISQICQESGAKIKVEETILGCNERVIVISGSGNENEISDDQSKDVADEDIKETEKDTNDAEKHESAAGEDLQSEKDASSVQKALMLVFERIAEEEFETNGGDGDHNKEFVIRLLVLSSQVASLSGKSGGTIKQMASESGAQIQILPKDKLPTCASSSDELVQISGEVNTVRKALKSVSQQLLVNPSCDNESFFAHNSWPSHSFGGSLYRQDAYPPFPPQGDPLPVGSRDGGSGTFGGRFGPFTDMLTYRLICSDEKVGGVIGKGGTIVKALKHETGCDIRVLEKIPESDDRIIVISGPAHPEERICAPQDAVMRVQTRIFRAAPESKAMSAKLIVSAHQIGCILGKAGAVISDMRKSTGAYIRILGKDQTPQYATENEEVVQINGDYDAVREALFQVTTCLRNHYFRDAFPGFQDHGPPFQPFMGRRELSPSGRYSSFNRFDAGPPPHGGFHLRDDRPPFMHDRPDFPHAMSERMPASAPWGPQGMEGGGPFGHPDFGAPQRRMGGFVGGSHQAIITNTTVEVVVPRTVVPSIYGEEGGCLRQIREISDAKITITDPKPGAKETLIIISGTLEQAHAAQSLIQAFVISETEAS